MGIDTNIEKINQVLNRGVIVEVLPSFEEFKKKLLSGEKLKFYIGFDPTSTSLHLSHAKNIILLEEFRKLGHEVILLFGDFTARIGDPAESLTTRKQLTKKEVIENVKEWKKQIGPLMDFKAKKNPPKIKYNSEWLSVLTFEDVVELASNFTVQQFLERDMFENRIEQNKPIHLHEFLYPLMQGYDSVAMDVDVELCGTDQIFNAMTGRSFIKKLKNKEKFVVAVNLMENPKTKELMSKSRGTGVFLDSSPANMFGAIMSQPDEMTELFLVNNTRLALEEMKEILKQNPLDAKKRTAFEVVKIFYGEKGAENAQKFFEKTFQAKKLPDDVPIIKTEKDEELINILMSEKIIDSKTAFRRLVRDRAVEFDGKTIEDPRFKIKEPGVVRVGKKRFVKIEIN